MSKKKPSNARRRDPTPAQIRRAIEIIQATWSPETFAKRSGYRRDRLADRRPVSILGGRRAGHLPADKYWFDDLEAEG